MVAGLERQEQVLAKVHRWLANVVLGLNLCPFARMPLEAGQVRICISGAGDEESLLEDLLVEALRLDSQPATTLETTLLVVPDCLQAFHDFNQFLDLAEDLLEFQGYSGVYQLATFHPHYQFAGTAAGDTENLTNCAPYPILHLLREASIERALAHYPDPESIPRNNIRAVQSLTGEQMRKLFSYHFSDC